MIQRMFYIHTEFSPVSPVSAPSSLLDILFAIILLVIDYFSIQNVVNNSKRRKKQGSSDGYRREK